MRPALVYDGDCPFCANYVQLLKLRERWPDLELVNARENAGHHAVERVRRAGLKIDEGMALVSDSGIAHGADSIHALARQGGMLNAILFSGRRRSRVLYPALRTGRNLALKLLGRRKLGF